jgi:hypothetical protein
MAENAQIKICPLCAETIKSAAKICPYCQSRQSRFTVLKGELAGAFVVILLIGGLIIVGSRVFPDESDSTSGRDFLGHRNDLLVVRTALESTEKRGEFLLSGFVTNQSVRPWRVLGLEARFLDAQGNMVEVQHREFDKMSAFVVQPSTEHAFQIKLYNVPNSVTGVVQIIRVESAIDGRKNYDPD